MAQFDVYQSVGPTVDVRLFGDAAKTGAALGKAIPSPVTSIIEGAKEGYKYGLDVETQSQQNQIRQHQIEQQPTADAQAQATLEHTRAQTERLIAETKAKEDSLLAETQRMEVQARNEKVTDELRTYDVFNKIDAGFRSSNPREVIDTISSPDGMAVLRNKPEEALRVMAGLDQLGADKSQYEPLRQSMLGAMRQKAAANRIGSMAGSDEKLALAEKDAFNSGRSTMRAVYDDLAVSPTMDPRKAAVGVRGGVTADGNYIKPNADNRREREAAGVPKQYIEDTTPVALYDGKIIKNISENESRDLDKAILDIKKYYSSNKLYDGLPSPTAPDAARQSTGLPGLTGTASVPTFGGAKGVAGPTGPITGDNIIEVVKARKLAAQAQAKADGREGAFVAASKRAEGMVTSRIPQTTNLTAPQNTPTPANQVPITKKDISEVAPTPNAATRRAYVYTPIALQTKLSLMLGTPATIDRSLSSAGDVSAKLVSRVNSIPELKGASALVKALVTVESGGNPNAVSNVGAQGLMQLMPETAKELKVANAFDPSQNVTGGTKYVQAQIDNINKSLTRKFGEQGIPIVVDPRIAFAAYNGGPKWTDKYIGNAISAGAVSWEDFQRHLLSSCDTKSGKSCKNAQTNIDYGNKVALTTIAYLEGGNAADDLIVKTWANFGMIHVG